MQITAVSSSYEQGVPPKRLAPLRRTKASLLRQLVHELAVVGRQIGRQSTSPSHKHAVAAAASAAARGRAAVQSLRTELERAVLSLAEASKPLLHGFSGLAGMPALG